jgi:hypothetical protein
MTFVPSPVLPFVPRPVLTFVVGVTGHRPPRLGEREQPFVELRLRTVFAAIEKTCAYIFESAHNTYARNPHDDADGVPYRVRLLTAFAEGTDQSAARLAPAHWEVEAILPMPQEAYEQTFAPAKSSDNKDRRREFRDALGRRAGHRIVELPDKPATSRNDSGSWTEIEREVWAPLAYARQGAFMLGQIDLLIAVWDGQNSAVQGGTSEVIKRALYNGVPVLWLSSTRDRAPWLMTRPEELDRGTEAADALEGPLTDTMTEILCPPGAPEERGRTGETSAAERLSGFLAEKRREFSYCAFYDCFKRGWRFWTWRPRIRLIHKQARQNWDSFRERAPNGHDFSERLESVLRPRHFAADALATHYGHAYRSVYLLGYVLAMAALTITLIGTLPFVPHEGIESFKIKAIFVCVELLMIFGVIVVVGSGRRYHWHARWMDYRALAEQLRHLRFLALVGKTDESRRIARFSAAGANWAAWYLRATIRELGLPYGHLDQAFQRKALLATQEYELKDQLKFHRGTETELSHLHHRLHLWGDVCFYATACVLLLFLGGWTLNVVLASKMGIGAMATGDCSVDEVLGCTLDLFRPFVVFLAALLPALGATLAGVRFTGDFEGFATRSKATADSLERLREDYQGAADRVDLDLTAGVLVATARVMTQDLNEWRSVYALKRLTLPA